MKWKYDKLQDIPDATDGFSQTLKKSRENVGQLVLGVRNLSMFLDYRINGEKTKKLKPNHLDTWPRRQ